VSEDRSVFELTALPSSEVISYGDHADQVIEVFRSRRSESPKVLLIHGGYWRPQFDRSHLRPYAVKLSHMGFDAYLLEYRRTPGEAHNYLHDLFIALDQVGECSLIGHSAGGQLALVAAAHPSVRKIVALAPVSDLIAGDDRNLDGGAIREFLGGDPSRYLHLDPASVTEYRVPVTVVHGELDSRVPVEISREFVAKYPSIEYEEIQGIGHFELIDPRREELLSLVTSRL
jgi:pimeloyl-ACP methyl ester carboxylesterase